MISASKFVSPNTSQGGKQAVSEESKATEDAAEQQRDTDSINLNKPNEEQENEENETPKPLKPSGNPYRAVRRALETT